MGRGRARPGTWAAIVGAVLVLAAACGGDDEPAAPTTTEATQTTAAAQAPTTTQAPAETTTAPAEPAPTCGDDATILQIGDTADGRVEDFDDRQYYCIDVPDGAATVTFTLSGLTGDLDLFAGYPDLATVQGGGITFWESRTRGEDDEVIVIEPGLSRGELGGFEQNEFVTPGSYYVEVSSPGTVAGSDLSSDFSLTIETA